jgi:hypothetical protein
VNDVELKKSKKEEAITSCFFLFLLLLELLLSPWLPQLFELNQQMKNIGKAISIFDTAIKNFNS